MESKAEQESEDSREKELWGEKGFLLGSDLGKAARIISGSQGLFYFYQFLSQLSTCINIYRHAKEGTWFVGVTFCSDIGNLLEWPLHLPPTPVIMSSLGYPPSPYGDDFIYEQPSTQSLLLLSPIQTVEEIARSGPGACSKEEKRECWSSFNPLQLFLPLKYKVTENLEIDKLVWQPADKTVLLL